MEYRVLTLWEPWASLVVHGIKKIETRPKPTSWTVEKGTYLIHAAKQWTRKQYELCKTKPFISELSKLNIDSFNVKGGCGMTAGRDFIFPLGHIIGSVEVKECVKIPILAEDLERSCLVGDDGLFTISEKEHSFGDYTEGYYAWLLQNPRLLETHIPYKGGQGYYQRFKGDINQLKFR